jgi:anti-sigma regulatory factor (Ser/Thr protein kinase)
VTPTTRWRFEAAGVAARLRATSDELEAIFTGRGVGEDVRYAARLVCEEIVLNAFERGRASLVTLKAELSDDAHVLTFEDDGAPFDPASPGIVERSDPALGINSRGRGLILVHQFSSSIEHRRVGGRNRLRVQLAEGCFGRMGSR